jgi:hypothetical protein
MLFTTEKRRLCIQLVRYAKGDFFHFQDNGFLGFNVGNNFGHRENIIITRQIQDTHIYCSI